MSMNVSSFGNYPITKNVNYDYRNNNDIPNQTYSLNQVDTTSFSKNYGTEQAEKGLSTGEKGAIATVLALALATGIYILTKGKGAKASKAVMAENSAKLSEIPEALQKRFAKLKAEDDESFVNKAYDEIVDYMGMKGIAPEKINRTGLDGNTGGFKFFENSISYDEGFFKANRKQQVNLLSHELQHCKQMHLMLRTEGIGPEVYINAPLDREVKKVLENPVNYNLRARYKEANTNGKGEEFLAEIKKQMFDDAMTKIKNNYATTLNMPKIKADSPEGIKAKEFLKGCSDYEGLTFGISGEKYRNNPLEVDAYAFGDKMGEYYANYEKYSK